MTKPVSDALVQRLLAARKAHPFPSQVRLLAQSFATQVLGVMFPHYAPTVVASAEAVREELMQLSEALERIRRTVAALHQSAPVDVKDRFLEQLGELHARLEEDAQAIFEGDPAAQSIDEVFLTYPGFYAIAVFRVANALNALGMPLLPRLLTEVAHEKTGVDIHPGAQIGRRFCIDHGTGVVIGETTHIGDGVKLYQGVTLGAATVQKDLGGRKRHPTIEDDVVIYAGATILGGTTVVGKGSIIGGNAWLTHSVPPNSMVTRKAEVRARGENADVKGDFDI